MDNPERSPVEIPSLNCYPFQHRRPGGDVEIVAVYVDNLRDYGWRHGPSCHLIADSVDELIEFAVAMGMRDHEDAALCVGHRAPASRFTVLNHSVGLASRPGPR